MFVMIVIIMMMMMMVVKVALVYGVFRSCFCSVLYRSET